MSEEYLGPKNLRPGPIRHEKLSPQLEEMARYTYRAVGRLITPTYEQWELDFLRDTHPERELVLWMAIAGAFQKAVEDRPEMDQKAILGDLVAVSTGAQSKHGLDGYYAAAWKELEDG